MNSPLNLRIRPADPAEAKTLLAIYAPYVENTAITYEYEIPSVSEFAERMRHVLLRYPYLVAECADGTAGYAYAGVFSSRRAYDWCAETSIYIKMDMRRKGIGRALYGALEACLKAQGILNLNACIASPEKDDEYLTHDSQIFHRQMGFEPVGTFHNCGYKFNRWYNMVWMEKQIGEHVSGQPPIADFSAHSFMQIAAGSA